ncbi:MAG: FtsX-like permease family protein [Pseudomonadota bacterium]
MFIFKYKNRSLGISKKPEKYDLPLEKDKGGRFLMILIGLMTFLMILTLSASFILTAMNKSWSQGIENKATVEIQTTAPDGESLSKEDIKAATKRAKDYLNNHPYIESIEVMSDAEIINLISPWLGGENIMDNIPLPGIISINFHEGVVNDPNEIATELQKIGPNIRLDTHQGWLSDILRLTGSVQFAAIMMGLIITLTTVVAVAGSIQSRMAVYKDELELLHLMGASDRYISRQLQRYAFFTALKGSFIGMIVGWLVIVFINLYAGNTDLGLLPNFTLSYFQIVSLLLLPVILSILSMLTSKQTVLRFLRQMP